MEKEYINRNELIRDLIDNRNFYPTIVKHAIEDASVVDAVEVVRCKDCKFKGVHRCLRDSMYCFDDDYCSRGERKEQ